MPARAAEAADPPPEAPLPALAARGEERVGWLRQRLGWDSAAAAGAVPTLVALAGLPGTGKSHLAAAIAERHPAVVVRSDQLRKLLFTSPTYSGEESGAVYLTSYAVIESLLRDGHVVIFDATNLTRQGRRRLQNIAEQCGAGFRCVLTVAPPDVVALRLERRAAGQAETYSSDADWQVHQRLAGALEQTDASCTVVDTSGSIDGAIDDLAAFLRAARVRA